VAAVSGQGQSLLDTASAAGGTGTRDSAAALAPVCHGEIVDRIVVHTYPPFDAGGTKFIARAVRLATSLHATTDPHVVRRFIPIEVGDRCVDFRLREAERILRAQPFIADANLIVSPDSSGGVTIDAVTFDEVSLVLDGTVSSKAPMVRAVRLGEDNLAGSAISLTGRWQNSPFFRDIYKGKLVDYQFLGRPYQLSLQGSRDDFGGSWDMQASHPFLTDLQRTSWRASAGSWSGYTYFVRPNLPSPSLQFTREYADVGGCIEFGQVGLIFLLGGTVSRERERTGRSPVVILDSAIVQDASPELLDRYTEHRTSRVNLLLGFRRLTYMRVRSFDAVEGTQDVRTGVQLATLIGRGLRISSRDERDYFMSTDLYVGRGTPSSFTAAEFMGERRRDMDTHESDGVLASGRAAWYAHPARKHTSIIDAEFSGGWDQRVPFQLRMSDRDGGLRGYGSSRLGGGTRLVMRFEDRYTLGHYRQLAALGAAVFVDAGRMWAGDVPFGVNTNIKYSAGIGLLAALPPRSRRTWRVDLAFPLNDRGDAKFEVRFTNHDFTRWFWREPGDVQAVRERAIPNSVYNWP
jgi:hypothetical protein